MINRVRNGKKGPVVGDPMGWSPPPPGQRYHKEHSDVGRPRTSLNSCSRPPANCEALGVHDRNSLSFICADIGHISNKSRA